MTSRLFATVFSLVLISSHASAHHGWSWAEADQVNLEGTVQDIYIGPPHPTLKVATSDGVWTVELANPNQTQRSGFVEGSAKKGDRILARGNRSQDKAEKRMKAVQITVGQKRFDIYPDRIKAP